MLGGTSLLLQLVLALSPNGTGNGLTVHWI